MATVQIDKAQLGSAYKYANLIRNKAKRTYANAYIAYWLNGGEGLEPDRGKLGYMAAQAVRIEIDSMNLWGDRMVQERIKD